MNSVKVNEAIEMMRSKLYESAKETLPFSDPSIVAISQKLDSLLMQAQRLKEKAIV